MQEIPFDRVAARIGWSVGLLTALLVFALLLWFQRTGTGRGQRALLGLAEFTLPLPAGLFLALAAMDPLAYSNQTCSLCSLRVERLSYAFLELEAIRFRKETPGDARASRAMLWLESLDRLDHKHDFRGSSVRTRRGITVYCAGLSSTDIARFFSATGATATGQALARHWLQATPQQRSTFETALQRAVSTWDSALPERLLLHASNGGSDAELQVWDDTDGALEESLCRWIANVPGLSPQHTRRGGRTKAGAAR